MRRSPIVLAATVFATSAVLAFHPRTPAVRTVTASTPAATSKSSSSTTASSASSATGASSGSSPIGSTAASGTATGDAIDTRYGSAQVRATVAAGKIVKIEAMQLQSGDPRSVQISSFAEPTLQQEALTAQTANVDAVSGATYTSASYEQSLQSALDKLSFKAPDGSVATLQVPS